MSLFINFFQTFEFTVIARLTLAVLLGGYIGAERVRKKRPAGIKTHAIVALGAALAMISNEFILRYIDPTADITRFGASIISGVGFIGAGTIMVTGRSQVTGLTTAAGIWLASCIGIAIGSGFYVGVLSSVVLLAFINRVLGQIDRTIQSNSTIMNLTVDCLSTDILGVINKTIVESGCAVISSVAQRNESLTGIDNILTMKISVYMNKNVKHVELISKLVSLYGVLAVEEA